jgi:hypothetical protein
MRFTVSTTFDAVGRTLPVVVDEVEEREYPFSLLMDAYRMAAVFNEDPARSLAYASFPCGWLEMLVAN